jgi:hypothetical protein
MTNNQNNKFGYTFLCSLSLTLVFIKPSHQKLELSMTFLLNQMPLVCSCLAPALGVTKCERFYFSHTFLCYLSLTYLFYKPISIHIAELPS